VARDRVFVGILNRFSLYALRCRMARLFQSSVYEHARFFSINEIRRMFYVMLGQVPVQWRTVLQFPGPVATLLHRLESSRSLQYSPFGGFAGIAVDPIPRFHAIPLALKGKMNHAGAHREQVASCAGDYSNEKIRN
jgi:hypothetical protein